jgi:serine/threonine kinase 32
MGCGASAAAKGYDPNGPISLGHFKQERMLGEGGFGKVRFVIKKDTQKGYAMKCMDKHTIVEKKHETMVFKERALLVDLSTPESGGGQCRFITNLHFAFQDPHQVYLVMDLALGGTLKYHLRKHAKGYPTALAQFYCAQIYNGLVFLHSKLILYRDCKPENILLAADGYCMLSDFGVSEKFASADTQVKGKTGTKMYMPPEALRGEAYGLEFDWWSFGVTVHELLTSQSPKPSASGEIRFGRSVVPEAAQDLVRRLLDPDRAARLGVGSVAEIREHDWLASLDWEGLANQTVKAPFIPDSKRANFDAHQDDIMSALDANPARRPPPSHSHPHPAPIVPTHPHAHRLPTTERHAATSRCRGREAFRVLPVAAGGGRRRAGGRADSER